MLTKTDNQNTNAPKYCIIKDEIKQEILDKKYDAVQGQLPSCRELVKMYKVSYMTVNKALNSLQDEGYIKMIQGKGIFATRPKRKKNPNRIDRLGLLIPTTGDIYQKIFSTIIKGFEWQDILPIPLHTSRESEKYNVWQIEEKFKKNISQGIDSFIVNGSRHFNYNVYKKFYNKIKQTIFLLHFDCDSDFKGANYILSDFRRGGYLAAECLLKNGRKKIGFVTFNPLSEAKIKQYGCARNIHDSALIDGIKEAFEANTNGIDLKSNFSIIYDDQKPYGKSSIVASLTKFFASGGDGIICLGDSRALNVYKYALENKIKIGEDIGVVGYYNTSWTDVYNPPLTSISIQEEKIAELAVEAVANKWENKRVLIEPIIIKRKSE